MKNAKELTVMRRFLSHADRPRTLLALMLLCALSTAALTLYLPMLASRAVDLISGPKTIRFAVLPATLAHMAALSGPLLLIRRLSTVYGNRIAQRTTACICEESLADGPSHFTRLITDALTILGALILMLRISAGTAAAVVLIAPASLFAEAIISRPAREMLQLRNTVHDEQTALIHEIISAEKTVQAFGQERACQSRFDEITVRFEQASLRAAFFSSLTGPCARFVHSQVCACAACFTALSAITGGLTIGQLACFLVCAGLYTRYLNEIPSIIAKLQSAIARSAYIFDLIDAATENVLESNTETADSSTQANQASPAPTNFCQITPSGY